MLDIHGDIARDHPDRPMTGSPPPERSPGCPPLFDIALARRYLRRRQAYWASLVGAAGLDDPVALALQHAVRREASATRDGPFIRVGPFKYEAGIEEARWSLTTEIIQRVNPGPFEDPRYFEMLARQAASIELGLSRPGSKEGILPATFARVIVGTTGQARSEASTALVAGVAVISVSGGLMEFLYQGAKALVLAWKEATPKEGVTLSFSGRPEDTEEVLDGDPYPATLLRDTLTSWLYHGHPRAPHSAAPAGSRSWPLSLLINGAERFVLAHEYGHALIEQLAVPELASGNGPAEESPWAREFSMDAFGAMAVVYSSAYLDRLPPNIALQGAAVAMKAHEIFDSLQEIVSAKYGTEAPATHPPFEQRLEVIKQVYLRLHPDLNTAQRDLAGMLVPARTFDQVWARIREPMLAVVNSDIPVHPVWLGDQSKSLP
jgi:hypothetical protein